MRAGMCVPQRPTKVGALVLNRTGWIRSDKTVRDVFEFCSMEASWTREHTTHDILPLLNKAFDQ